MSEELKPFVCLRCRNALGLSNGKVLIWRGVSYEREKAVTCHWCFAKRVWYPVSVDKTVKQSL